MAVNIDKNKTDAFYRYKMPAILTKVEGRGNGTKTVIVNLKQVSDSLNRPSEYLLKHLSYTLGSSAFYDRKNDRYILSGMHRASHVQVYVHNFIQRYVLCVMCNNPETVLEMKRVKIIKTCNACGHSAMIPSGDKLASYMLKSLH